MTMSPLFANACASFAGTAMPDSTGLARTGSYGSMSPGQAFLAGKEMMMDEKRIDADKSETVDKDEQAVAQGERNREKLDEIPEPGTDPLHEGP
jgi:hypothetical protein